MSAVIRHLTADDVAAELGRTEKWVRNNWRRIGMPKPVAGGPGERGQITWSAAHFYAWLDRDLPKPQQQAAAAFRAAAAAYVLGHLDHDTNRNIESDRAALDQIFSVARTPDKTKATT